MTFSTNVSSMPQRLESLPHCQGSAIAPIHDLRTSECGHADLNSHERRRPGEEQEGPLVVVDEYC